MADSTMKVGRESALTFSGIVVNAALAFVVTWMIANGLGADATGGFFLLTSLFMIVTGAAGLGADTGLVKTLSTLKAQGRAAALRPTIRIALLPLVAVGLAISLVLWLGADRLADLLGLGADAVSTVRVLAVSLLPATLTGVLLGGCRGLGRISSYTVVQNLFIPIMRVAAVGVVVFVFANGWAVVWAWALPLVLAAILAGLALERALRRTDAAHEAAARETTAHETTHGPLPHDERADLRRGFWSFSLPRGGTVLLERALDWADVLLVIALLGPAAGGIYGIVTRIVQAGNMLEAALRIVMGPRISAQMAQGRHRAAEQLYLQVTQFLILASWPFYLAVAVFARDILQLFGDEFVAGAPALIVLACAMALRNTVGALQTVLLMIGKSTWQLGNRAAQLVVLVVLCLVAIPLWGLLGAACAFAVSVVVDTALAAVQVHRALGFRSDARAVLTAAAPPLIVILGGGLVAVLALADAGLWWRLGALALLIAGYGVLVLLLMRRGAFRTASDDREGGDPPAQATGRVAADAEKIRP